MRDVDFDILDKPYKTPKDKDTKTDTKPVYAPRYVNCCVCGDRFNADKRGRTRWPRSERKRPYYFCTESCKQLYDDGFIE